MSDERARGLAALNPIMITAEIQESMQAGSFLAILKAHNALRARARAGDWAAIMEVAEEEAGWEDERFNRAARATLKAARRRWRNAYQWSKWGE